MHQTENPNAPENALDRLFSTIEMLSSKIDELNERVDFMSSFIGLEIGEGEDAQKAEPPGQLAGLSFDVISKIIPAKDANSLRAYFLRVLSLFRKYIKAIVMFGSSKTKTGLSNTSDIDVAFIVDDTDIQKFTLQQLKDRLFVKMAEIARDFSDKIHAQAYPLSEFWSSIIKPNPVILTILRDGVAVYDTGFFIPIQLLYKTGKIIPTQESIDSNIESAEGYLMLVENVLTTKLTLDLFNAVVSAGQALLMEYGYLPPVPKEVSRELMLVAVEKEKVLTKDDVEKVNAIISWFKKIDHGELKTVNGDEFERMRQSTKYVVEKIFVVIERLREKKGLPKPVIDKDLLKQTESTLHSSYSQKDK
ncbi:nucleotidyltransferase domain-containing protein [Candidatus Parvarchaeota archaeon]|nr:nucleotidyltransferase domain-containing protein [Candidatus Parvarchaeota archaeon]